jgi:hypothetical protein
VNCKTRAVQKYVHLKLENGYRNTENESIGHFRVLISDLYC